MTKDEALRLALEALEKISMGGDPRWADDAITAIKAALEAKDEPEQMAKLGWQVIDCPICGGGARAFPKQEAKDEPWEKFCDSNCVWTDHHPDCKLSKDEPVAWRTFDGEGGYDYRTYENNEDYANDWDKRNPNHKGWVEPLYTTPPQRTWVGLTEEDLKLLSAEWRIVYGAWMDDFAKDIEAKLKEKNNG